jgi:hypothetical protein
MTQRKYHCSVSLSFLQVEAALTVIRSALANGVSWSALAELVARDTQLGNPIASLIRQLKVIVTCLVLVPWKRWKTRN